MRRLTAPILALVLSLLLVVSTAGMGMARGQMRDASGTIVLCTGTGPVSVAVDADGTPIGPQHICPDCVMNILAGVAAPFELAQPERPTRALVAVIPPVPTRATQAPRPLARGPPTA